MKAKNCMSRTYKLSQKARADLKNIWNYSYDRWGATQADKYYNEILDAVEATAKGKKQGAVFPDRKGYFKIHCGSHFAFYIHMEESNIFVLRILHQSMDLPSHLTEK